MRGHTGSGGVRRGEGTGRGTCRAGYTGGALWLRGATLMGVLRTAPGSLRAFLGPAMASEATTFGGGGTTLEDFKVLVHKSGSLGASQETFVQGTRDAVCVGLACLPCLVDEGTDAFCHAVEGPV